jgi:hypothetical protein
MNHQERYKRILAVNAFKANDHSRKRTATAFKADCKRLKLEAPKDAEGYCPRWNKQYDDKGDVEGNASNSGRKPKISKGAAAQLVEEIKNWAEYKRTGPFSSIRQLQQTSPTARAILQEADAAISTIIRAVQAFEPKLQYELLVYKQRLTAKQMAERVRVALLHITISLKQLELVVWIDAKTMYMQLKSRHGWVIHGEAVPIPTTRPMGKKDPITLKYYIGVCGRTGAVFLRFYTGTTGMKADRNPSRPYLVSSDNVQLPCLTVDSCSQCLQNACLPARAAAVLVFGSQPNHLKPLPHSSSCQCPVSSHAAVQICTDAVLSSVWYIIMLLPFHFDQNPGWLQH